MERFHLNQVAVHAEVGIRSLRNFNLRSRGAQLPDHETEVHLVSHH